MIIKKDEIINAKDKIRSLIINQAEYGDQTKVIQSYKPQYFALGQFLGDYERNQRGIHGSSTALRVLADTNKNEIVQGLILYLQNRTKIESSITLENDKVLKLERDAKNTIKICEILYSLSFVKIGQANTEHYIRTLKNTLVSGFKKKGSAGGWGYFIDEQDEQIQLLPTAYAILALESNRFSSLEATEYLRNHLKTVSITDPTALAEVVFSLFSLLNSLNDYDTFKNEYDDILNKIWDSEYCTLIDNYEQNLEYWFNTIHEYIRVPWQLYLLAITCKVSPWKYYSVKSQKLLRSIVILANESNFKYPYSGPKISTRTNAILYETLAIIQQNLNNSSWYNILFFLRICSDEIRRFVGSSIARYCLGFGALLTLCISIYSWVKDSSTKISDLGPEFLGWIFSGLIALLLIGKRK